MTLRWTRDTPMEVLPLTCWPEVMFMTWPATPLSAGYAAGESCTLDYTPPVVAEIIRLDESPTNAPVVHFGVRFSEPVTGVPLAAPFAGFSASGLPDAAVVAISGNGAAYAVSVKTGPSDGVLQLAIDADAAARDAAPSVLRRLTVGRITCSSTRRAAFSGL